MDLIKLLPEFHNKPLTTILIMHPTLIVSRGMNANITEAKTGGLPRLILESADSEHIQMHLKTIWRIVKKGGIVEKRDGSDQEILLEHILSLHSRQSLIKKSLRADLFK